MVLPNPRATYKALLLDYDALLAYSDDECCYSLSAREIQMLLAFVDYIGWKTRYIATETEIDQDLIDAWSGNLARKLMSGCCPDEDLGRFTDEGVWQTSDDGGETWVNDPETDPRNTYIQAPPLPGADGNAKRCAAADNIKSLFTQYRDQLDSLLTSSPTLVSIIAGILAFLAVITGVSGAAIGISVLLMGLAAALLQLAQGEILTIITPAVLEQFKCLVYCRLEDNGQITYENWLLLLQDIASTFDGFAETFFFQTVNGMGYIGLSNAGTIGVSTAADCGDCDCPEGCSMKYEIGPIGIPEGHGEIISNDGTTIRAQTQDPGNGGNYIILAAPDLGDCCYLNSVATFSGGAVTFMVFIPCGTPYSEGAWTLGGTNQCVQLVQVQCNAPAVIDFVFSECP